MDDSLDTLGLQLWAPYNTEEGGVLPYTPAGLMERIHSSPPCLGVFAKGE
jgi:hypothetical protein